MATAQQGTTPGRAGGAAANLATMLLGILLLFAPLKFGSVVGTSGLPMFPLSAWDWAFGNWPPILAPVLAGAVLLAVLFLDRSGSDWCWRTAWPLVLPVTALIPACLVGLVRTTEWDLAFGFGWHVLGAAAVTWAVFLHVRRHPETRGILLGCIAVAALLAALSGVHQRLWGFAETREMIQQLYRETGRPIAPAFLDRLSQDRVFGPFTYPNNLAAHLLLTSPVALVAAWRWGARFEPAKVSRIVMAVAALALLGTALVWTGSRAAMVAVVLALCATTATAWPYLHRWFGCGKRALIWVLVAVAILVGLLVFMGAGRGLSSLGARIGYYDAGIRMFAKQPLTGVGLGEFFPHYMRLKPPGAEETRVAHSLFFTFLAQCGIVGGAAAGLWLLQPLLLAYRRHQRRLSAPVDAYWLAAFCGLSAWLLHALADFNVQIPGSVMTACCLPILVLDAPIPSSQSAAPGCRRLALVALGLAAVVGMWRLPGERAYQLVAAAAQAREPSLRVIRQEAARAGRLLWGSPYPFDILGKTAMHQGDYRGAAAAFKEAARRAPHRGAFQAHLAECQLALGDIEAAAASIEKALEWYPYSTPYLKLAQRIRDRADAKGRSGND